MREQNNATCSICGSSYHLCVSCRDSMKLHPWKIHCCSANCYKVFQIVKGYNNGVYSKGEAKEKFKNVDLKNVGNYVPHIKKIVEDILKEDKVEIKTTEKIEKTVDKDVEESTVYRKRNFKVEIEE